MRYFKRQDAPKEWQDNQDRWNAKWVERVNADANAKFDWYQIDKKKANEIALPVLKAQTQSHCSFCDAFPVSGVSNDTIEHFKPKKKDRFPHLAYTWSNLYFCCNACQTAKGTRWDDQLLAPDADGYECFKFFDYDFTNGQIRPSPQASGPDQLRAKTTITLYGLDSAVRRSNRRLEQHKYDRAMKSQLDDMPDLDSYAFRDYLARPLVTVAKA